MWEDGLLLYVAYLIEQGLKSTTVKSYISGIKNVLAADVYVWNENRALLNSLTKACKLKYYTVTTRFPISIALLEVILFELHRIYPAQVYLLTMYRVIFALAYH